MNKHLNDGQLRAALDDELDSVGLTHLESCSHCQMRKQTLQTHSKLVADQLTFLSSETKDTGLSSSSAWLRFKEYQLTKKETNMFRKLFASPLVRYGVPSMLILALVFAFPGTRALASEILNLFRVQQVTVVPVDFTGMERLSSINGPDVSQLISDSITMNQEPGDPVQAQDASQASQLTGFNVRVPQDMTPSSIYVTGSSAFTFTIDQTKAQALLNEAGRSDLILPNALDGARISVDIPSSVSIGFGNCPPPSSDMEDSEFGPGIRRSYAGCIILAEIPSPSVSAPASVDVTQLAQIALEFSGMTSEQAAAFTSTVDWTSTLVVPIPKNASTYEQVAVDGVTGTLIQRTREDAPQFALIWVKNGIIYAIGGVSDNLQQALDIANSLP
ncbi:MAG: hypothetical protein IPP66_22145 [Anaerolineales bacterium]|nr:hypothetical protein [Anaerolineales bacterium]